jgi:copper(I)-binding protein
MAAGLALGVAACSGGGDSTGGKSVHASSSSGSKSGGDSKSTSKSKSTAPEKGKNAGVTVSDARIEVSSSGADAHLTAVLTNASSTKVSLLGASSSTFAVAQLVRIEGGKAQPLPKGGIPLEAKKAVHIDGKNYGITLKFPIMSAKKGDKVRVEFSFDNGSAQTADAVISADVTTKG